MCKIAITIKHATAGGVINTLHASRHDPLVWGKLQFDKNTVLVP